MKWATGTVRSYSRETGEGVIAMDGGGEQVQVDFISSDGILLYEGLRVRFTRIHRPQGVFAAYITLISSC
ncbi:cold shock domain-containing protein [Pseudomonas sp. 18.1.10]|nr:cold shock domain-containing protein [Pseudomonas sp. 18.1.10]